MEILFDNGTIVAKLESETRHRFSPKEALLKSGHWKWDTRVSQFRAPAFKLYEIARQLRLAQLSFAESITKNHTPLVMPIPPLELRQYQIEAFNAWNNRGRRGVVVLPTGAGKTRLALHTILEIKSKTLILVPTRVLLYQWRDEISKRFQIPVGILGDGHWIIKDITVATYESAIRSIGSIGDLFSLVVIDEVHHFLSGQRIEIIEMLCSPFCLGLSATYDDSGENYDRVRSVIGSTVFRLSIDDLKGTVLAPFQKILILAHLNVTERRLYEEKMAEFRAHISELKQLYPDLNSREIFQLLGKSGKGRSALSRLRESRQIIGLCEDKLIRLSELLIRFRERKVIIFTADTGTALRISVELLIFPILAETPKAERKLGLDLFMEGQISAIVTCRVLNEGFDMPSADMAIIVGGTHGEREHIQRIGRVLRQSPGKSALIYELVCKNTIEMRQWRKRNGNE